MTVDAALVLLAPVDVGEPGERPAEHVGLGLVEQARAAAGLDRDVEGRELLDELRVGGAAPDEHRDVAVAARRRSCRSRIRLAIQPASSSSVVAGPDHDLGLGPAGAAGTAPSSSRAAPGSIVAKRFADVDDLRAAAPVGRDLERRDVRRSASRTSTMLRDVRAAPLVDRLIVVADDAELDVRAGEELDQALLRGLTSWYSSTIRWRSVAWTCAASSGRSSSLDRADDLLAVGEQAVALERREVVARGSCRNGSGIVVGIEQLVLDDVDALEERLDRGEQPVAGDRAAGLEPASPRARGTR